MPDWFDKLRRPADSPDVADYQAIRAASKTWFAKIMAHPGSKLFDITKAGKKLGLSTEDGPIVFDDESEMAVFMDYFLFDYRPKQRSLAESCVFAPWSVPETLRDRRRTGYFLGLNRKWGLPQVYADVVPSPEAGDKT